MRHTDRPQADVIQLHAETVNGVILAPDREEIRRYAVQYVASARLARKAGKDPQRIARDQLEAIGAFMATLPESERAGFQEMLAEEVEAAHAAAEQRSSGRQGR